MVSPVKDKAPRNYINDEKAVKRFVRQMIKNHYFIGSYLEKRYVYNLNCYKKIVKIAKNEEIFMENLSIIKRRLENFYQSSKWIGISCTDTPGAPVGFNIWVDIDEEVLGVYKFWVRDVLFPEDEVVLKIEIIKPYEDRDSPNRERSWSRSIYDVLENSGGLIDECEQKISSWSNIKNGMVFSFLLLLTLITGGGHIIKYILDYLLKLLEVSTPIIIAFFDTIAKMFGYLCFLIAFFFKKNPSDNPVRMQHVQRIYYQPAYPYENRYKALPYNSKSSVVIKELDE